MWRESRAEELRSRRDYSDLLGGDSKKGDGDRAGDDRKLKAKVGVEVSKENGAGGCSEKDAKRKELQDLIKAKQRKELLATRPAKAAAAAAGEEGGDGVSGPAGKAQVRKASGAPIGGNGARQGPPAKKQRVLPYDSNFGSFFGPSEPVVAQRIVEEAKRKEELAAQRKAEEARLKEALARRRAEEAARQKEAAVKLAGAGPKPGAKPVAKPVAKPGLPTKGSAAGLQKSATAASAQNAVRKVLSPEAALKAKKLKEARDYSFLNGVTKPSVAAQTPVNDQRASKVSKVTTTPAARRQDGPGENRSKSAPPSFKRPVSTVSTKPSAPPVKPAPQLKSPPPRPTSAQTPLPKKEKGLPSESSTPRLKQQKQQQQQQQQQQRPAATPGQLNPTPTVKVEKAGGVKNVGGGNSKGKGTPIEKVKKENIAASGPGWPEIKKKPVSPGTGLTSCKSEPNLASAKKAEELRKLVSGTSSANPAASRNGNGAASERPKNGLKPVPGSSSGVKVVKRAPGADGVKKVTFSSAVIKKDLAKTGPTPGKPTANGVPVTKPATVANGKSNGNAQGVVKSQKVVGKPATNGATAGKPLATHGSSQNGATAKPGVLKPSVAKPGVVKPGITKTAGTKPAVANGVKPKVATKPSVGNGVRPSATASAKPEKKLLPQKRPLPSSKASKKPVRNKHEDEEEDGERKSGFFLDSEDEEDEDEYEDEEEYEDDYEEEDEEGDGNEAIMEIRNMFKYDPSRYRDIDREDDRCMVASWRQQMLEEARSAKIAEEEDERELRLIQEEERRERMRKKQKLLKRP